LVLKLKGNNVPKSIIQKSCGQSSKVFNVSRKQAKVFRNLLTTFESRINHHIHTLTN